MDGTGEYETVSRPVGRPVQTHCLRGHAFTPANTAYRGKRLNKICRQCEKLRRNQAVRQRLYRSWEEKGR